MKAFLWMQLSNWIYRNKWHKMRRQQQQQQKMPISTAWLNRMKYGVELMLLLFISYRHAHTQKYASPKTMPMHSNAMWCVAMQRNVKQYPKIKFFRNVPVCVRVCAKSYMTMRPNNGIIIYSVTQPTTITTTTVQKSIPKIQGTQHTRTHTLLFTSDITVNCKYFLRASILHKYKLLTTNRSVVVFFSSCVRCTYVHTNNTHNTLQNAHEFRQL